MSRKRLRKYQIWMMIDEAVRLAEHSGIVFIDEIDKIAGKEMAHGPDVSREDSDIPIVEEPL